VHADWAECLSRLQAAMARLRAREHIGATTTGRPQVSQKGQLLSRRGCGLPANASALDTHRDSIDSPAGLAWSPCRTTTATSCSRGWGGGASCRGAVHRASEGRKDGRKGKGRMERRQAGVSQGHQVAAFTGTRRHTAAHHVSCHARCTRCHMFSDSRFTIGAHASLWSSRRGSRSES
jgi:hypothetical protein